MRKIQSSLIPEYDDKIVDVAEQRARREFEVALADFPFGEGYAEMMAQGLTWQQAAVAAWSMIPKSQRVPATKGALAGVLGCSPSKISRHLKNGVVIQARVQLARIAYMAELPEIVQASIEVASDPSYKSTPERGLILKNVLGVGTDRLEHTLKGGDMSEMSDAELEGMIDNDAS